MNDSDDVKEVISSTNSGDPIVEAVRSYMATRNTLCQSLSTISSLFERETVRRDCLVGEIERIDAAVVELINMWLENKDSQRIK